MNYKIVPVTPFQQNASIVWCENTRRGGLIDPGGEIDKLLEVAESEGITLEKILLTHGHLDHVGGVSELVSRLGLPVFGPHRDDDFWIKALPEQSAMLGLPAVEPFSPDYWLDQGDDLTIGDCRLEVFHTPGHTPGHIAFYAREDERAWVGDVLFAGSIGRTDFPKGDHASLIRTIRQTLFPLGDNTSFVPGHGPMSTFGQERLTNPFVADTRFG